GPSELGPHSCHLWGRSLLGPSAPDVFPHQRFPDACRLTSQSGGCMHFTRLCPLLTVVPMLLAGSPVAAQDFHWAGALSSGQKIEIRGVNGSIRASASGSGQAEVTATKESRRSNAADVRIEVVPDAGGVTICAVYPDVAGREPNRCGPGGEGKMN